MDLAWRLVRGATSNAIILVRDGMLIGLGAGQTSRVDAARLAIEKARQVLGPARLAGEANLWVTSTNRPPSMNSQYGASTPLVKTVLA